MEAKQWAFWAPTSAVWHAQSLPATIWQVFPTSEAIAKIGFYNDESCYKTSPKKVEIVATNDCPTKPCEQGPEICTWTTLLSIEDAGFTGTDQFRSWVIPAESRSSFRCHGVRVYESVEGTVPGVALRGIKVWKSQ